MIEPPSPSLPYLVESIIRLQLKKPKNWNWELSTSKSSPQIALPIIQLYNAKGQLILQTKDQRNSWHCSSSDARNGASAVSSPNYKLNKCASSILDYSLSNTDKRKSLERVPGERRRHRSIKEDGEKIEREYNKCETIQETRENPDTKSIRHHQRSRSDDVFRRKLKSNEESLKRAETDGYKNFLTMQKSASLTNDAGIVRRSMSRDVIETNPSLNNRNRYKTRTSSAGTLIISEESFNNNNMRRSRRRNDNNNNTSSIEKAPNNTLPNNTEGSGVFCFKDSVEQGALKPKRRNDVRQVSDPTHREANRLLQKIAESEKSNSGNDLHKGGLFYSLSDVFRFKNSANSLNNIKHDEEPAHEAKVLSKNNKRCRKICRSSDGSDASTSSSSSRKKKVHHGRRKREKARVVKEHPKDGNSHLLQLVRRLSPSEHHVKMGANVSRHSSKGLSGRRSQSSGSICNGKGRQQQQNGSGGSDSGSGKMCGSLPNYLDDRDSTGGCNNNHDECEKPPLDEVQRIPPLGDGAPLHWKFSDNQTVLCDQGYGSERSPEEEYPPPLPDHDSQCHHHLEPHACYPFITPESTFIVKLSKSSRGLGLSVTGGIDSGGSWPGLIRIKRLFPHQPASQCGLLNVGDLIIEANGITLTGLTNYEALEVLRTASNQVDLKVCRPPPDVLSCVSPISEVPPPPPRREPPSTLSLGANAYITPEDDYYHGEFEVTLSKIQGSLGFTLRKEDDSALGHYVRALVREPALTDGRIRAGDKIIAVNEVEISPMTHEQAVQFLRQCGDVVKLRLYRDSAQTPVAALSPTETTPRASFSKKTHLRQEAVDMLNDIAVRKLIPGQQESYHRRTSSPQPSPRRLRRPTCPSDAADCAANYILNDEQFHEALLHPSSSLAHHPFDDENFSLFTIDPEDEDDEDRPSRPSSLDLYNPNQTPVATRKPRFNFSLAHNAYELNNLDPEVLDAPNLTYNLGNDDVKSTEVECGDSFPKEPASMPHIPVDNPGFSYKNPAYQSAHPPCGSESEESRQHNGGGGGQKKGSDDASMKRRKGAVCKEDDSVPRMQIKNEYEILAIELNRGWNSRLGFSLQGAAGVTYVSAVHADSVAAKDGRLKPGDRVIKVNDESVEHMSTSEIIDLLRIVRGPVCIVVSRIKSKEDCPSKSNAEN